MEIKETGIDFLGHSGFVIRHEGKRVAIDPYNISDHVAKVDVILITHSHYDHCSIKDIAKLAREGTIIAMTADAQSKITKIEGVEMHIVEPGDEFSFGKAKIEAVPAYNVGKEFHPKKEGWVGYVVKLPGVIVYHTGDSDQIPEMKKLTGYGKHGNEFIALLPVSGHYVMSAEQAAAVASFLKPDLAIPMHYGAGVAGTAEDAERFKSLCEKEGVKAEILHKI
ncbi:MBL fold metallo-hydrolase [Candidatus Pacearchaeota archaeon]|nr:MBL fold metallo-hydrolase [Candidatus Pacearchaeota archaeon]